MISIFVRTIIIYALLSLFLKLMGKRQIGELEIGELVSTLLISEVAAIPIDEPDLPLLNAIIPTLLILCAEVILSSLKNRSPRLKRIVEDQPVYIIYKGRLLQKALLENRVSINELLSELRSLGFGSISEVEYAILESSGKVSAFAKAEKLALTHESQKAPDRTGVAHTLVIDGRIDPEEPMPGGFDKERIREEVARRDLALEEVLLMTVDDTGNIEIIKKERTL